MNNDDVTCISIVLIQNGGERNFIFKKSGTTLDSFSIDDVDFEQIRNASVVSFGSVFVHPRLVGNELKEIFKEAKKFGAITCADLMINKSLRGLDDMADSLPYIDFIMPNLEEAVYYTKKQQPDDAADVFLQQGVKNVVIKLGAGGCLVKSKDQRFIVPSYLTKPIDTTGAGDNFVAGFITGILKGWPLEKCGEFANATASIAVRSIGATTGVTGMPEVLNVMNGN